MKTAYKFISVLIPVLFFAICALVTEIFYRDEWRQRQALSRLVSFFSRIVLHNLNIEIRLNGDPDFYKDPSLVICNHQSYLDIFILSSVFPTSYVTSVEMRDTFFLGHLCRLAACVFVERRNKVNIHNEIQEITTALQKDLNVTIFPEATSANGDALLRFRKPLFNAAIDAQVKVQPLTLNYTKINDKPVTRANRDIVCWYDTMAFLPHFLKLFEQRKILVQVDVHAAIAVYADTNLDDLVASSFESVNSTFSAITN